MSQPTFFPEGSTPRASDTRWRILQKILGATLDGGGVGGGGTTVGAGAPGAGVGSSGDTYWDETNKIFYVKDADGWNIH